MHHYTLHGFGVQTSLFLAPLFYIVKSPTSMWLTLVFASLQAWVSSTLIIHANGTCAEENDVCVCIYHSPTFQLMFLRSIFYLSVWFHTFKRISNYQYTSSTSGLQQWTTICYTATSHWNEQWLTLLLCQQATNRKWQQEARAIPEQ